MRFYQAYVDGTGRQFELRNTREEAQKDLAKLYEICGLREEAGGVLYDPNRRIGIAVIII